jgi:hypothetical protein
VEFVVSGPAATSKYHWRFAVFSGTLENAVLLANKLNDV